MSPEDRPATIELMLALIESKCPDFLVANGGGDPNVPKWYALGYWHDHGGGEFDPEGDWEIDVKADTLYEVLFDFITDPRFGQ